MNIYRCFPCFGYLVITFVPYSLLLITVLFPWRRTSFCSRIHMWSIRKITQVSNNFHPPSPVFYRGGDGGFTSFVYIFGKVLKRTWLRHGRVRPTPFMYPTLTKQHSTYYMTISVWWWSLLMIDVPHVDVHSTHMTIPIVDFHRWFSSLTSSVDDSYSAFIHVKVINYSLINCF